jgi:hypothetical protein
LEAGGSADISKGKPIGAATWEEWDDFWYALRDFVCILNEETTGQPFEIDAAGVVGDAEMLLKALKQSQHFDQLFKSNDPTIVKACIDLALPRGV